MSSKKINVYFDINDHEIIENLPNFKYAFEYEKEYEDEWGRIESKENFVVFIGRPNELNKKKASLSV